MVGRLSSIVGATPRVQRTDLTMSRNFGPGDAVGDGMLIVRRLGTIAPQCSTIVLNRQSYASRPENRFDDVARFRSGRCCWGWDADCEAIGDNRPTM